MCWGFECSDGWFKLIHDLSRELTDYLAERSTLDLEVMQVKSKFGSFRYYVEGGDESTQKLIEDATERAKHICELTGKGRQTGCNVSHANNRTKRVFLPNLQNVTLLSEKLDRSFKFRVSANGLRSVEHNGGLDNWLLKTSDTKLSVNALKVKRELAKKAAA